MIFKYYQIIVLFINFINNKNDFFVYCPNYKYKFGPPGGHFLKSQFF